MNYQGNNPEGYPDPTANQAVGIVSREEKAQPYPYLSRIYGELVFLKRARRIYGTVIIWICLNYVISKNILLICQKTSLQLPVDIFPYLNGGYATDNIAKITP